MKHDEWQTEYASSAWCQLENILLNEHWSEPKSGAEFWLMIPSDLSAIAHTLYACKDTLKASQKTMVQSYLTTLADMALANRTKFLTGDNTGDKDILDDVLSHIEVVRERTLAMSEHVKQELERQEAQLTSPSFGAFEKKQGAPCCTLM